MVPALLSSNDADAVMVFAGRQKDLVGAILADIPAKIMTDGQSNSPLNIGAPLDLPVSSSENRLDEPSEADWDLDDESTRPDRSGLT